MKPRTLMVPKNLVRAQVFVVLALRLLAGGCSRKELEARPSIEFNKDTSCWRRRPRTAQRHRRARDWRPAWSETRFVCQRREWNLVGTTTSGPAIHPDWVRFKLGLHNTPGNRICRDETVGLGEIPNVHLDRD